MSKKTLSNLLQEANEWNIPIRNLMSKEDLEKVIKYFNIKDKEIIFQTFLLKII